MSDPPSEFRITALEKRVDGHDRRLSGHDRRFSEIGERSATTAAEFQALVEDVRDLVDAVRATNNRVSKILGAILAGIWALVLVLVPIAMQFIQGGGT